MINLEAIVRPYINRITPEQNVLLYLYSNQVVDDEGTVEVLYNTFSITAQMQPIDSQTLQHIQNINVTKVYKRFFIQYPQLTGLNRTIEDGGDYIFCNNIFYKVVQVSDQFNTGWLSVIGCASDLLSLPLEEELQ